LANALAISLTKVMNKSRISRKKEHLILASQGCRCSFTALFEDILLPHDCLTAINPAEADLSAEMCGIKVSSPLYINAITGGALISESVNRQLAKLAKEFKLPMAVGSQIAGISNPRLRFTYQVARKFNPGGIIMANLPAAATSKQAMAAVEMLEAQLLQLYLNPAQEYIMPEGDRVEEGLLANIAEICAAVPVPVVVKEVGFGIGAAQARKLAEAGVQAVDVSGAGGTNFARIEGKRGSSRWWAPLASWGMPTPLCVADVAVNGPAIDVYASGGVDDGISALKCLCLGASAIGNAGGILWHLRNSGLAGARKYVGAYLQQLRTGMALMGKRSLAELDQAPLLITGKLKDLLAQIGIDSRLYWQRGN
jgi:isopentenyl-diphosphate delta-isomerase